MAEKLTDAIIKALPIPTRANRIHYDAEVKGFGCRVTKAGARAFILNYRTRAGKERRYTIGAWPDWKAVAARQESRRLKQDIDRGLDPLGEIEADLRRNSSLRLDAMSVLLDGVTRYQVAGTKPWQVHGAWHLTAQARAFLRHFPCAGSVPVFLDIGVGARSAYL